ncbi:MAG: VWA domain-containing protein [Deltaproteobacteria bacterium]|nr:VWA domain-containing protein [Deltaproteobacteria bacterium]
MKHRTWVILAIGGLLTAWACMAAFLPAGPRKTPAVVSAGGGSSRVQLSVGDVVTLTAALGSSHVLAGGPGDLALDVALEAGEAGGSTERVPVDVALVIDRSGSMAGEKIQAARAAAHRLVGLLRPGDRVALVSYASDVTVQVGLIDPGAGGSATAMVHGAIDGMMAEGSTFLDGGLSRAAELLGPAAQRGRAQRIVLISDGEANVGRTTSADLDPIARTAAERGVTLSTIGVGLAFNERLMMGLADAGAGNYYYLREGSELALTFTRELEHLSRTVARAAVIEITPAAGTRVVDVSGHMFERTATGVTIRVGDLPARSSRKVLVRLAMDPAAIGPMPAAAVTLRFEDARARRVVEGRADLGVTVTDRVAEVERGRDREVMAALAEVEASEGMATAMSAFESGDTGGARQGLAGRAAALAAQAAALGGVEGERIQRAAESLSGAGAALADSPAAASPAGLDLIKRSRAQARELAH